jgi:hypothetical protein
MIMTGMGFKEGNKWNRNAYYNCKGKNSGKYGKVCI